MNFGFSINDIYQTAIAHYSNGRWAEAEEACRQMLGMAPKNPDVLHFTGIVLNAAGKHRDAVKMLRQAVKVDGSNASYHCNLGLALQNAGDLREASVEYRRALVLNPALVEVHMNYGNILKDQGDVDGALERLQRAQELAPDNAAVHYNLGLALQKGGANEAAAEAYRKALALNPYLAMAYTNLGMILKEQGRMEEAIAHYQQALALDPNISETYNNLGIALNELQHYDAAAEQYKKALALKPDNPETLYNLGFTYRGAKKIAEAMAEYEKSLSLDPDNANALCELLHQRHHACLWGPETATYEKKIIEMARRKRAGISPFIFLNLPSTPAEQRLCAETFSRRFAVPEEQRFRHVPGERKNKKIRIGYLSADYHQHATAYLMAELFERHDRKKFEVFAYSYGPDDGSNLRARLIRAFDRFTDIRALPHAEAARTIHDDGVDILIDLKGYTGEGRMQIAAYRPAPVQVNYLGYPGTMGADFMDYIIGDPFITPMDQQDFYAEKIVQLPHTYQPNDTKREIAAEIPSRADCGLPAEGFVFCSFNSNYKITPEFFDIWMRLLQNVAGSVLWLFESNPLVRDNLQREATLRGVDPARLVFAPGMLLGRHLARHRHADLFLDTLPVNAHTTASDALWAGLPVLTCAGATFAGRVAGSLVKAAGLPELAVSSLAEYEALALDLARDPARLSALRDRLAQKKLETPLFDISRFVTHIERAYETMWRNWQDGKPATGFSVADTE